MRHVDLILRPRWLIPVEPAGNVLENHAIAVNDGKIVAVLPDQEIQEHFCAQATEILPDHIVIPGLINLQTLSSATLLRGFGRLKPAEEEIPEDLSLESVGYDTFVHDSTLLACVEMLHSGITCFCSPSYYPESKLRAIDSIGLRAVIGLAVTNRPNSHALDVDACFARGLASRDRWHSQALTGFSIALTHPETLSDQQLVRVATLSDELDLPIHMPLANRLNTHTTHTLAHLCSLGLVNPGLLLVDPSDINPQDMLLLAKNGVSVACSPCNTLINPTKTTSLLRMLDNGLAVGLSTKHSEIRSPIDLFQEARLADLLIDQQTHTALYLATLGGACALGLENEVGSIRANKWADLCAIAVPQFPYSPGYSPTQNLLDNINRQNVSHVWVAGRKKIDNGMPVAFDKKHLANLVSLWQTRLRLCRSLS